jgi:hypothetical protein
MSAQYRPRGRPATFRVIRRDDKRWSWEFMNGLRVRFQGPSEGFGTMVAAEKDLHELFGDVVIQDPLPGLFG